MRIAPGAVVAADFPAFFAYAQATGAPADLLAWALDDLEASIVAHYRTEED